MDSLRTSLDDHREQLDQLQGKFLKGKERKALQSEIDGLQGQIDTIEQDLKNRYGLREYYPNDLQKERYLHQEKYFALGNRVKELEENRTNVAVEKDKHLREYKYMSIRCKSFRKEWQSIVKRFDNNYEPPMEHKRAFSIECLTANERASIKKRLKEDGLSEKTKAYSFVTAQESKSRTRDFSRGKEEKTSSKRWNMER